MSPLKWFVIAYIFFILIDLNKSKIDGQKSVHFIEVDFLCPPSYEFE